MTGEGMAEANERQRISCLRVAVFTVLAMIAFAGNSLLCRAALAGTAIDLASFTTVRLLSGATVLLILIRMRRQRAAPAGSWASAWALFGYAAGFSFAYVSIPAGVGALLLFLAVQATMIGYGVWTGERLRRVQWIGLVLAFGGLCSLVAPGLSAPPIIGSVLMILAGVAWGIYSIRGKGAGDATVVTAGNFLRAAVLSSGLSAVMFAQMRLDPMGLLYALLSGGLTSGIGYAIWYAVLPSLRSTTAATVQLSVPVIAAVGGTLLLGEAISLRLLVASLAIVGGIALTISDPSLPKTRRS